MTPPVRWGVYRLFCPLAIPEPKWKYVIIACEMPNGHYGGFPVSSRLNPPSFEPDVVAGYVRLNGARYPTFMTETESWVDCHTGWPFPLDKFTDYRETIRPDDRQRIFAAAMASSTLRRVYKNVLSATSDW